MSRSPKYTDSDILIKRDLLKQRNEKKLLKDLILNVSVSSRENKCREANIITRATCKVGRVKNWVFYLSIYLSIYRRVTIIYADVMHEHSRKRGDARPVKQWPPSRRTPRLM